MALATYPKVGRTEPARVRSPDSKEPGPRTPFLFGLAPCGVCPARCIAAAAVRSYRTFSPLPMQAVYFLWHFPEAHAFQVLPGALPYGARTFLFIQE